MSCGYADQSHMTREFRRFLGITPGKLRSTKSVVD
ncbi:MAG: AraC family transcriptional regulator [Gemmatimonadota bacterium]